MADTVVHIGENSPEYVAYRLLGDIAAVENHVLHGTPGTGQTAADRAWILDTYLECWRVTQGKHHSPSASGPRISSL